MTTIKNTFIVSDESINSHGFRVLTKGISIDKFLKNPIMLYMHERDSGIIGRWENLRIEDDKLMADAVFDESDPIGKRVKERVESGFMRCASISIDNVKQELSNDIQSVVECDLKEISIVDMPSNSNAVKLYKLDGKRAYQLSELEKPVEDKFRERIISLLGLQEDASEADILNVIKTLQNASSNVDEQIDNAIKCGYIDNKQRDNFRAMALSNQKAFESFVELRRGEVNTDVNSLLDSAVNKGKLLMQDKPIYELIASQLGVLTLKQLLDTMHDAIKPSDIIYGENDRSKWTLNDYRKFAPLELKDNTALYERLLEKEGNVSEHVQSLEYYRRNKPEYLRNNPELYQQLLDK